MAQEQFRPDLQQIDREYQRDVVVVSARPKLAQAGILLWTLVDVALIAFFIVNVVLYLVSGSFTEQREIASIGANAGVAHNASVARTPETLIVDDVKIITRGAEIYDLYATVENANEDWIATVTYLLQTGAATDKEAVATILPGETKYFLALDVESKTRPAGAELIVRDVQWQRVDRHEVADIVMFMEERENFVVESSVYATDVTVQGEAIARSTFTVKNSTPYSYYQPTFVVLLKKANVIVGINQVMVEQFVAGETRDIDVHWFGNVPSEGLLELVPAINYFDEDAYMDPDAVENRDRRDDVRE